MAHKKKLVILTGAGISQDSGIKTFRDEGGLWEGHPIEEVATPQAYRKNPQLVLDFYNARRRQLQTVEPNAAHYALKSLEKKYTVFIITQNVDNLHERAGSSNILHLHGELNKVRSTINENEVLEWYGDLTLDDRDSQNHPLRPHIVWFGEAVPNIEKAIQITSEADILIIIGTSLQVYPAANLLHFTPKDTSIYLIDPNPIALDGVTIIKAHASKGVPLLVHQLLS
ncbi:MAG: NAD-dependent deacylase [Neisseriaceae bacterium]|nr:MAG: NAD-dependent deacylase [Neisseriaceae bacterium]